MLSDNLAYRGKKLQANSQSARRLEIARAARKPRMPRRSPQFYKENNAPWASITCADSSCHAQETQSSVSYFFRARKAPCQSTMSSEPNTGDAEAQQLVSTNLHISFLSSALM